MSTTPTTPSELVCALPRLIVALHQLQQLQAGEPLLNTPEAETLPTDAEGLLGVAIGLASDIEEVVQAAFDQLSAIHTTETRRIAGALDEIL